MIDTFTIRRFSGPCDAVRFDPRHHSWADRSPIVIASGERIRVTLYGHGANLAQNATGSRIFEWISEDGTSTDYPNAPIMFGARVPKGYVTIDIRAASSHGIGERTVNVYWATGRETLKLRIVASCADVVNAAYRTSVQGGVYNPPIHVGTGETAPNVLPHLNTPYVLTRPIGQVITPDGAMMVRVADYFGEGLPENVVTAVPVPKLTWGVAGVNIHLANTQFDAQLIDQSDPNNPRVLDTLSLPQGFPDNTPLVTKDNYPGRLSTIRVVRNPRFQVGTQQVGDHVEPTFTTYHGTFTEPGSTQVLDPGALLLVVDSNNRINEGRRENDNELPF
jgi:hypothetical protein